MKTLLLSLALLLPAHSQQGGLPPADLDFTNPDEIPADPRAPQDVSDKALISGFTETGVTKILNEETLGENIRSIFEKQDLERNKQALRDLKAVYEKAIAEKNLELIKPHLAADFTAVMITADEVRDYDGIKAYWKKVEEFIGEDGTYTVSVEPDDTIFEGNTAIAKGTAREHVVRNGKPMDLTSKWTAIARQEGGTWKLVRIQASIDPVNNPIITALNKGKLWITGAVAGIVGLVIGLLLRRTRSGGHSAAR